MAHVPPNETMAEIIEERIVAFGLRERSKDRTGIHGLARQISDRLGVGFSDTNLTNWRDRARRPTDPMLRRFALGTAGPPYQGNADLPPLTSEHMLQRVLRARSGVHPTEAGPELTQSWQHAPAEIRRDINTLLDRIVAAIESGYWDGRRAAAPQEDSDDDPNGDAGPTGGLAQS